MKPPPGARRGTVKGGGGIKNGKREIIREKINEKRERRGITNATMGLG